MTPSGTKSHVDPIQPEYLSSFGRKRRQNHSRPARKVTSNTIKLPLAELCVCVRVMSVVSEVKLRVIYLRPFEHSQKNESVTRNVYLRHGADLTLRTSCIPPLQTRLSTVPKCTILKLDPLTDFRPFSRPVSGSEADVRLWT